MAQQQQQQPIPTVSGEILENYLPHSPLQTTMSDQTMYKKDSKKSETQTIFLSPNDLKNEKKVRFSLEPVTSYETIPITSSEDEASLKARKTFRRVAKAVVGLIFMLVLLGVFAIESINRSHKHTPSTTPTTTGNPS